MGNSILTALHFLSGFCDGITSITITFYNGKEEECLSIEERFEQVLLHVYLVGQYTVDRALVNAYDYIVRTIVFGMRSSIANNAIFIRNPVVYYRLYQRSC